MYPGGVKGPTVGPSQRAVCQMGWARLSRQTGVTRVNQWLNPLKRGTGSNLVDAGRGAMRAEPRLGEATPILGYVGRVGGHTEGLRGRCGDVAGEELGTDPADRYMVNVGTVPVPPNPPPSQGGGGQVRRRLMAWGWDGASVVVRARESLCMAKGGSESATAGLQGQECTGECR